MGKQPGYTYTIGSYCHSGSCVAIAVNDTFVAINDTKAMSTPIIVSRGTYEAFIEAIRTGYHDHENLLGEQFACKDFTVGRDSVSIIVANATGDLQFRFDQDEWDSYVASIRYGTFVPAAAA